MRFSPKRETCGGAGWVGGALGGSLRLFLGRMQVFMEKRGAVFYAQLARWGEGEGVRIE